MFDRVAPYYDRFNTLLSVGFDRRWRRHAARSLKLSAGARVLDVATGTGALARTIAEVAPERAKVVGCDLNPRMLAVGQDRLGHSSAGRNRAAQVAQQAGPAAQAGAAARVWLVRANAECLPFSDDTFDAATIGFALDDFADRVMAVRELQRVIRPGGELVLLELSLPDQPMLRRAYRSGLAVFGLIGRLPGRAGYSHLREEITRYRGVRAIVELLANSGFGDHRFVRLTGGIATLHHAVKRPD